MALGKTWKKPLVLKSEIFFYNIIFFLTLSTIYIDIQSKADTNFSDSAIAQ